jgi:hypothetical protein
VINTRKRLVKVSESKLERIESSKEILRSRRKVRVREIVAFVKLVNLLERTV